MVTVSLKKRMHMQFTSAILAAGCLGLTGPAESQAPLPGYCDKLWLSEVKRNQVDPFARYQPRGQPKADRCEGALFATHSGGGPELVGIWRSCGGRVPQLRGNERDIGVQWIGLPNAGAVRLRIRSTTPPVPRVPYRLDTERPPGSTGFRWSRFVLKALNLGPEFLGVLAQTNVDGATPYVPVAWNGDLTEGCASGYYVQFDGVRDTGSVQVGVKPQTGSANSNPDIGPTIKHLFRGPVAWIPLKEELFPVEGVYDVTISFEGAYSGRRSFKMIHTRGHSQ